jgi:hypothetical protein
MCVMTRDDHAPAPPPVPGDATDWTWVLERICPECRFDASQFPRERIGATIRQIGHDWQEILDGDPEVLRQRPRPDRWSTLEYGCHVRDVLRIFSDRVELMLSTDNPAFANWDQDATAVADRYDLADPATVRDDLGAAADHLAGVFDPVRDESWSRTGLRSDGAKFTVDTIGRYLVHDPIHHLYDVTLAS